MRRTILLIVLVLCGAGCKSILPEGARLPWSADPEEKKSLYQQPAKMVVIWSPAMYSQPGQAPTRGFGGRIYFYNAKEEAIAVDGQLVVYAFDDTNRRAISQAPDKRFAFPAEHFTKHFSPTQLGASYSVWIPWDAVGNPQADISLLPIFTCASGAVVTGQQSRNLLPGPESPKPETYLEQSVDSPLSSSGGSASGWASGGAAPGPSSTVMTHTINLPETTASRLVVAPGTATQPSPQPQMTAAANRSPAPADSPSRTVAAAAFSAPSAESRSWGPVVPRRSYRPAGLATRSEPSSPQVPAAPGLPPVGGPPPTPRSHAGLPYPPPGQLQSAPPLTGQVIYRDESEIAP